MAETTPRLDITLQPVKPEDYLTLAKIEAATFDDDDFSVVAFGPQRHSDANLKVRADGMAYQVPSVRDVYTKAVLEHPSGETQIVGFAGWGFVTNRDLAAEAAHDAEEKAKRVAMTNEERKKDDDETWGEGANVKFCEEAFGRADEAMYGSCKGGDYCKLRTLAVEPAYQRKGIGSLLLKQGLDEADSLGLQSILGASPEGEGLYERFGYELVEIMGFKLWEYEGGESFPGVVARHVVMRRPPASSQEE